MAKGLIADIDRFSTHDGPGIRTAIFLKGCPLSCKWCHSPETLSGEPEVLYRQMRCSGCGKCIASCLNGVIAAGKDGLGIVIDRSKCKKCFACVKACNYRALYIGGVIYSAEELVDSIKPDIPFFGNSGGGVTITGGEPLAQGEFTLALVMLFRELGIHTIVQTSGFGSAKILRQTAAHADMLYYDIKFMPSKDHGEWVGVSNELIMDNLRLLCCEDGLGQKILVRVPCIPGVNDSAGHIREIAAFAHSLGISGIELLPYNPMAGEKYSLLGTAYALRDFAPEPQSADYMKSLYQAAKSTGITVIEGLT